MDATISNSEAATMRLQNALNVLATRDRHNIIGYSYNPTCPCEYCQLVSAASNLAALSRAAGE